MSSLNSMSERIEQLINEVYVKNLTKRDLELQMLLLTDQSAFSV